MTAGSNFVNLRRTEFKEPANKLMSEKFAIAQSKETMKTVYKAQPKLLQDQISILMNHTKVTETNSHISKDIANTARNWKIGSRRL